MTFWQGLPTGGQHKWRAIVALVGLCLSVAAALLTHFLVSSRVDTLKRMSAVDRVGEFEKRVEIAQTHVRALAALFNAANNIQRPAFNQFVAALQIPPELVAMHWIPRIQQAERGAFESALTADGFLPPQIRDRDQAGDITIAGARQVYFPIRYSYPVESNRAVIGIDILSNKPTADAVAALTPGSISVASAAFSLVQDSRRSMAISIYVPVYAGASDLAPLRGFAAGILQIDALARDHPAIRAHIVSIVDVTGGGAQDVYRRADGPAASPYFYDISVAPRTFRIYVNPEQISGIGWFWVLALITGLLATTLIIASADHSMQQRVLAETTRELQRTERSYYALFENAGTANCEVDADSQRILRVNQRMCELFGYERDAMRGLTLKELTAPTDIQLHLMEWAKLTRGEIDTLTIEKHYVHKSGKQFWGLKTARLVADGSRRGDLAAIVIQDITDRKASENARDLLVRELAHRLRNTMQLVNSLAEQTAKNAVTATDYKQAFQWRLRALINAQDMLFDSGWNSVSLKRLVAKTLSPFRDRDGSLQVSMQIDDVQLTPQQSQSISLAVYELASNSVRHGALSAAGGTVEFLIRVEALGDDGDQMLHMDWTEKGGPTVRPPKKKGFGLVMLERLLARQHDGHTKYDWSPEGVRYTASLPLRREHLS